MFLCPPRFTLFPYTTLFRSSAGPVSRAAVAGTPARAAVGTQRAARADGPPDGLLRAGHAHRLHDQPPRSEEHTSELQSLRQLVCRLLLEKKKKDIKHATHRQ